MLPLDDFPVSFWNENNPRWRVIQTAAAREWAYDLPLMLVMGSMAVRGLMCSRSAISWSGRLSTNRRSSTRSRSVGPAVSVSVAVPGAGGSRATARPSFPR